MVDERLMEQYVKVKLSDSQCAFAAQSLKREGNGPLSTAQIKMPCIANSIAVAWVLLF